MMNWKDKDHRYKVIHSNFYDIIKIQRQHKYSFEFIICLWSEIKTNCTTTFSLISRIQPFYIVLKLYNLLIANLMMNYAFCCFFFYHRLIFSFWTYVCVKKKRKKEKTSQRNSVKMSNLWVNGHAWLQYIW